MEQKYHRYAFITLIAILLVSGAFGLLIKENLELDYEFENFFPQDDPDTQYFLDFREKFESDNDFVLVAVRNDHGIFDSTFLYEVNRLTDSLSQLPQITQVISPTNLKMTLVSGSDGRPHMYDLLSFDKPEYYATDSASIYSDPRFVGTHFSKDGKSVALIAKTEQYLGKDDCDQLTNDLKELLKGFSFNDLHVAGRAVGQSYYIDLMTSDFIFFFSTSAVLLVIFLFIAFRSFWGIWVPLTVVMLSTLWTLGTMVAAGGKINLVLTMLPTIMFVVGISDVVHIVTRYLEELRGVMSKLAALKSAYREVGIATFLTSLTTAIGFFSLLTVSVGPIQDFGLYTGIGVFLAYILAFTMLPSVLVLRKKPEVKGVKQHHTFWYKLLHRGFYFVLKNPVKVIVTSILLFVGGLYLAVQIDVNNYLLEDLADDNELKKDFVFLEENFAGVRPFEMGITVKDSGSVLDHHLLLEMGKVQRFIEEEYGAGNIISPVTMVKSLNMAMNSGEIEHFKLPGKEEYKKLKKLIDRNIKKDTTGVLRLLMTEDQRTARIQGKVPDKGSMFFLDKNDQFEAFLKDSLSNARMEYTITGTAHLIDKNNSYLASSLVTGLLIAFGVISLIAGFFFRSLRIIPIALIPNVMPLVLISALMEIMGQDLKVSTSIIFTIAFGIAVDDTIHFLSKLRLELAKGRTMPYAIKRTYLSSGRAIVITTLILCSGFLTLLFSEFQGTFLVGLMVSVTLFLAVLADLTLLPALLLLFFRKKYR